MIDTLQPWQFRFAVFCGWVYQRQTLIIELQNDQITNLIRALGKKRLLLNDNQRRLLAVKGKAIARKALLKLTTIVTPDTILGWHRKLVAEKWDYSEKRKSVACGENIRRNISTEKTGALKSGMLYFLN